jgi:hypothetical protein
MKKIISDIHNAEQNSRKTIEFLTKNSAWTWIGNYPIALVNEITRVKDEKSLKDLEQINFFDTDGFSKNSYTKKELDYLTHNVPSAIKTTYCICLNKKQSSDYIFKNKFPHDRWKKVTDEQNFAAFVESSKFSDADSSKVIETALRDIMRSAKEIPSLKATGFVWIVTVPQTVQIETILEHYFLDNYIFIPKGHKFTYIAWADKLADINMRYFVNTP